MTEFICFSEYKKRSPKTKYIINWWELNHTRPLILEPKYQRKLLSKCVKKAGNFASLSRSLKLNFHSISNLYKLKQNPRIYHLIKLMKYLNWNFYDANNKFIEICNLKNPKLPFNLNNPEGAEIIAAFLSDGHLPKNKNPMYCAYEKELHLSLIKACEKVFGNFNAPIRKGHNSLQTRFPCSIGSALKLSGVPTGDKRRKNILIPRFIFNAKRKIQTSYLRRVFDDEGDVNISKRKRAVRLSRSTDAGIFPVSEKIKKEKWIYGISNTPINNILLGEYLLLRKLNIDARLYPEGIYFSRRKRITSKWRIQIAQQDNLKLFNKLITFSHSEKKKKLIKAIFSYVVRQNPHGLTEKILWEHILELTKKKKLFTFKDIGTKLVSIGFSYDFAGMFLRKFTKIRRIEKMKRGVYSVCRNN